MSKKVEKEGESEEFISLLEKTVRDVANSRTSENKEKLDAVDKGIKLLAIRHKIGNGDDDKNFFGK